MMTRWMIRVAVLTGVLSVAALAHAAQRAAGGAAPAPAPNRGGGGAAGPANPPARSPNPAPTGNNNNNNAGKNDSPQRSGGNASNGPRNGNSNGGGIVTPRNDGRPDNDRSANNGPRTAQGAQNALQAERAAGGRHADHRDGRANDHRRFYSPQYIGWAPYTWWYGGNSYWWPSDYDNGGGYRDNVAPDAGSATANNRPATPVPDTTPTPAQDQARNQNDLEGSPLYAQTMAEFKKAQATYDAASQKALEQLKSNEEYKALIAQRDRAEDRVEAVQASAKIPSPAQVTPAAQQKLDVSARITRMEQDAINNDPTAKSAKTRLVELNEKLTALRKQAGASAR